MKVLMINGSPRKESNAQVMLDEMTGVFEQEGIEVECICVGKEIVRGCVACGGCGKLGKCVHDDIVNEIAAKLEQADGLVVASPVYYASANGTLISILDRLFFSASFDMTMKVGAAVACARRGGITATWDELNKYFGISGMPIATGQYWNGAHGRLGGEASQDAEGMQQMRTLARNMVFLMKSIALGREQYGLPEREPGVMTNFIR
ncbi:MAG: flavodoxin family protein [Eggerthellaceae bacterium]|jgi:multimeric flavodoxin WrbA|nr:flavodoxin family protein [Eggerthellaceae bacterium]